MLFWYWHSNGSTMEAFSLNMWGNHIKPGRRKCGQHVRPDEVCPRVGLPGHVRWHEGFHYICSPPQGHSLAQCCCIKAAKGGIWAPASQHPLVEARNENEWRWSWYRRRQTCFVLFFPIMLLWLSLEIPTSFTPKASDVYSVFFWNIHSQ